MICHIYLFICFLRWRFCRLYCAQTPFQWRYTRTNLIDPHFSVLQLMTGRHKGCSLPEIVMLFVVLSCPEAVRWAKRLWVGVNNILCLSDNTKISEPCCCKTKALVFSISAPGNRTYSMPTASNRGVSKEVIKGVPNSLFSPVVSSFQLVVAAPLSAYDVF